MLKTRLIWLQNPQVLSLFDERWRAASVAKSISSQANAVEFLFEAEGVICN